MAPMEDRWVGKHKCRLTVHAKAVVVADAELRGAITIGSVIQPRCKIDASLGPIQLGENCIVEEGVELISTSHGMHIGNGNWFRAMSHVCSREIGHCNVFQPKCNVAESVNVPNFCTIGPNCHVQNTTLQERTVLYGSSAERRIWSGEGVKQRLAFHAKQLQHLHDTLAQTHTLRLIR